MLFPPPIIDVSDDVTLLLVSAIACQWVGIKVVPRYTTDFWITVGGALWMAMSFMSILWGRNEYRFRQKQLAISTCETDVGYPSLHELGRILTVDSQDLAFLTQKAQLVLFILNNRIIKAMGRNGVERIFWRIMSNAATGYEVDSAISTPAFIKCCEKVGHLKLDNFFTQWVYTSGCPQFVVTQRFNKKKLVVELTFRQEQRPRDIAQFSPANVFHHIRAVRAERGPTAESQLFTGPMTIRIHEADGTPYEHIVDINGALTKVEIPYNTKYKRLRRNRAPKDRTNPAGSTEFGPDVQDDVLLYCLGDVLQADDEIVDWKLADWSKDDELRMSEESYEWIRIDKDFEWICDVSFAQPHYMFISQLQQDPDVVAQVDVSNLPVLL